MILNWNELRDIGVDWMEYCELTGTNEWARNEGLMSNEDSINLTSEQLRKLLHLDKS